MGMIQEQVIKVRERIAQAARRVGRAPTSVKLMAVTKTVPVERIQEAIIAGVDVLGESYVQEARDKIALIGHPRPWHLVGHLQTNKAKYAVRIFDMIHSLDRMEVALALHQRCLKEMKTVDVLIEVNVSGEQSKWGVPPTELLSLITDVAALATIHVRGLMTVAPWSEDPEDARPFFKQLRVLSEEIEHRKVAGVRMEELSMGMSDDYEVAVEEGATIVRIGRAILGIAPVSDGHPGSLSPFPDG